MKLLSARSTSPEIAGTQVRRSAAGSAAGRAARLVGVVALTAASWSALAAPAANAATAQAVIRAAHFSPTTPGVDVYLTPFSGAAPRTAWISNVSYGAVSDYQTLTPGLYTVAMRLAGSNPATPPALSWVLDARAGAAYTIAGVGAGTAVRGVVIPDDLTNPPAGEGLVRVIQAASRAPIVSVTAVGGPVISAAAQFGTVTRYIAVPAGNLQVRSASTRDPAVTATETVQVKSGQITSILLLDGQTSGITMRALLDSAAAATVPVGPVPAGGGGTAVGHTASHPGGASRTAEIVVLAALAVSLPALAAGRSRTRRVARSGRHHEPSGRHDGS